MCACLSGCVLVHVYTWLVCLVDYTFVRFVCCSLFDLTSCLMIDVCVPAVIRLCLFAREYAFASSLDELLAGSRDCVAVWVLLVFSLFDGSLKGDDLHANVRVRVLVSVLLGVLLFLLTELCVVI